jgi:hypothetical protein
MYIYAKPHNIDDPSQQDFVYMKNGFVDVLG